MWLARWPGLKLRSNSPPPFATAPCPPLPLKPPALPPCRSSPLPPQPLSPCATAPSPTAAAPPLPNPGHRQPPGGVRGRARGGAGAEARAGGGYAALGGAAGALRLCLLGCFASCPERSAPCGLSQGLELPTNGRARPPKPPVTRPFDKTTPPRASNRRGPPKTPPLHPLPPPRPPRCAPSGPTIGTFLGWRTQRTRCQVGGKGGISGMVGQHGPMGGRYGRYGQGGPVGGRSLGVRARGWAVQPCGRGQFGRRMKPRHSGCRRTRERVRGLGRPQLPQRPGVWPRQPKNRARRLPPLGTTQPLGPPDRKTDRAPLPQTRPGNRPRPAVEDAEARAREHFLAALSDILSRGLRHAVAPPAVAWRRGGQLEGAASPYATNVRRRAGFRRFWNLVAFRTGRKGRNEALLMNAAGRQSKPTNPIPTPPPNRNPTHPTNPY